MAQPPEWLTLEGGESVVWTGRPRTLSIARPVLGAVVRTVVVLVAVGVVWSGLLDSLLPETVPSVADTVPGLVLPAVALLAVVWGLGKVVWAYLVIANVDYVLTDVNLYKKTGVFSETTTRIGLDRIQSTSLSKDFFGNLFDYGSVAISTAGGSGIEMLITDLANPDELRTELRTRANQASGGRATGGGPTTTGLPRDTLRELVAEARKLRETTAAVEEVLEG